MIALVHELFAPLLEIWFHWMHNWGFWGIVILMAMESSIFPVPSEMVVPPAAILAAAGLPGFPSLAMVWFAGTLGSYLGSAITYGISRQVGRPVIIKYGRYFLFPPDKVERAERFMHSYEGGAIFFGRLLPVMRHLISIPAGIFRMNFWKFSALTIIGSAIWCAVLAWLGHIVGKKLPPAQMEALRLGEGVDINALIESVKGGPFYIIVGAVVLVCVLYFVAMKLSAKKADGPAAV